MCRNIYLVQFCLSGQLSLLPSAEREISSSLQATGWRPSVADWSGGMSACCKPRVQLFADKAMDGRIVRCGIISSCQSAATSEIVKRFWSRTHVRSAITSIATFTFYLYICRCQRCRTSSMRLRSCPKQTLRRTSDCRRTSTVRHNAWQAAASSRSSRYSNVPTRVPPSSTAKSGLPNSIQYWRCGRSSTRYADNARSIKTHLCSAVCHKRVRITFTIGSIKWQYQTVRGYQNRWPWTTLNHWPIGGSAWTPKIGVLVDFSRF